MVTTNNQSHGDTLAEDMQRAIAQHKGQPTVGTPTDSQYTAGQTPADIDAAELAARAGARD
jgi:hypothetical protein